MKIDCISYGADMMARDNSGLLCAIPPNQFGIPAGDYTTNQIVKLLREAALDIAVSPYNEEQEFNKNKIHFIADMMEL